MQTQAGSFQLRFSREARDQKALKLEKVAWEGRSEESASTTATNDTRGQRGPACAWKRRAKPGKGGEEEVVGEEMLSSGDMAQLAQLRVANAVLKA